MIISALKSAMIPNSFRHRSLLNSPDQHHQENPHQYVNCTTFSVDMVSAYSNHKRVRKSFNTSHVQHRSTIFARECTHSHNSSILRKGTCTMSYSLIGASTMRTHGCHTGARSNFSLKKSAAIIKPIFFHHSGKKRSPSDTSWSVIQRSLRVASYVSHFPINWATPQNPHPSQRSMHTS